MEIALRYKLLTLSTLFTLFTPSTPCSLLPPLTLLTQFKMFTHCLAMLTLLKQLVACMPICIVKWFEHHPPWEGYLA